MRSRAALTFIVCTTIAAMGSAGPAIGVANASDASATREYLAANYLLVRTAKSYLKRAEAAPLKVLAHVTRECPQAAASSPQDSQSSRLNDEVIGAMVIAAYHLDVPGLLHYVSTVRRLHWSSQHLTHDVRAYASQVAVLARLRPPNLCADVSSWAASGFKTLAASTLRFDGIFMPAWVKLGKLPSALRPYESAEDRNVAARSNALEVQLIDGEARAVESWSEIMNELVLNP